MLDVCSGKATLTKLDGNSLLVEFWLRGLIVAMMFAIVSSPIARSLRKTWEDWQATSLQSISLQRYMFVMG